MIALRCTQKMLRRLGQLLQLSESGMATNALGHWYVDLVHIGRAQLVMATSERSLLTALMPARHVKHSLVPELTQTVHELLSAIGVPGGVAGHEIEQMRNCQVAKTSSRRVLGCMNDYRRLLGFYFERTTLLDVMLQLADVPMLCGGDGIIDGLHHPSDAALHLLGLPLPDRRAPGE